MKAGRYAQPFLYKSLLRGSYCDTEEEIQRVLEEVFQSSLLRGFYCDRRISEEQLEEFLRVSILSTEGFLLWRHLFSHQVFDVLGVSILSTEGFLLWLKEHGLDQYVSDVFQSSLLRGFYCDILRQTKLKWKIRFQSSLLRGFYCDAAEKDGGGGGSQEGVSILSTEGFLLWPSSTTKK